MKPLGLSHLNICLASLGCLCRREYLVSFGLAIKYRFFYWRRYPTTETFSLSKADMKTRQGLCICEVSEILYQETEIGRKVKNIFRKNLKITIKPVVLLLRLCPALSVLSKECGLFINLVNTKAAMVIPMDHLNCLK